MALGTQRGDLALGRNVSMSSPWRTPLTICLFGAVTFASRSTIPNRAPLAHPVTLFVKLVLQDDLRDVQQHYIKVICQSQSQKGPFRVMLSCALARVLLTKMKRVSHAEIPPIRLK